MADHVERGQVQNGQIKLLALAGVAIAIAVVGVGVVGPRREPTQAAVPSSTVPSPNAGVGSPPASTTASPRPRPTPEPTVPVVTATASIEDADALQSYTRYTSRAFRPGVSFWLQPFAGDATASGTDFCPVSSSEDMLVLPYLMSCTADLRIIHPDGVDCGTGEGLPSAAVLAAVLVANLGLQARVVGDLTATALPATLFDVDGLARPVGRVVLYGGGRAYDPEAVDPDGCRLVPPPGSSDPAVQIRGDHPAGLVILDVGDELVVVRVASNGLDNPTTPPTRRDATIDDAQLAESLFYSMLGAIRDLRFEEPGPR
jgi:hypothetical protein